MKNVTDFYNKTTTGWSDEWFDEKNQNAVLTKFYNCFGTGGTPHPRILDVGCGAGYDARAYARKGAKVVGIDVSENSIAIARKKAATCKFFVGDITDPLTKLGKFDGISCLATIMHIDVQNMKTVFDNFANVLKPGGLLLISAFDGMGKNYEKSYVELDGDLYDKEFNNYSASELCAFAYPNLKLVDTWKFEDFSEGWRYYVFIKQ
jgi:2-polyprenyl-3-methyl-5-hydroxy-6-metoxy-1,4-benzoquinol methylase